MGLPIVTALIGIFVGAAGVGILSGLTDVPSVSQIVCMMIAPVTARNVAGAAGPLPQIRQPGCPCAW